MNSRKLTPLSGALALATLALLATPHLHAADATWTATGNENWSTGSNWSTNNAPGATSGTANTDIATFGVAISGSSNVTVTVDANRNIGGITFNHNSAKGYALAGNILLSNGGIIQSTAQGGHDDSTSSNIYVQGNGGSATLRNNAAAGNRLNINAVFGTSTTGNTTTLYLEGTNADANNLGALRNGSGGGTMKVVKNGTGTWRLTSLTNDYSGGTILNAGTLQFGENNSFGTGTLTINGGTLTAYQKTLTIANAVEINGNFTFSKNGSAGVTTLNGAVDLGGAVRTITVSTADAELVLGGVVSNGGVTKAGVATSTLTLKGINTYTGNTTVTAGTLTLADDAGLTFAIGANGVNNKITGSGTVNLDGDFTFDLGSAAIADGNSWTIVDVDTLTATFGTTFSINGFIADGDGDFWTKTDGGNIWTFTESTGVLNLQAIPEPATVFLGTLGFAAILLRRRHGFCA